MIPTSGINLNRLHNKFFNSLMLALKTTGSIRGLLRLHNNILVSDRIVLAQPLVLLEQPFGLLVQQTLLLLEVFELDEGREPRLTFFF